MKFQVKKPFLDAGVLFKDRFLYFGRSSGIHGLNHLFRVDAPWIVRLFWLSILIVSAFCLYLILIPIIQLESEINFTPDTLYLNWTTKFPAVTVCEKVNVKKAQKRFDKLYPQYSKPITYNTRRYMVSLMYNTGTCSGTTCVPCGEEVPCDFPWKEIINKVHLKCVDFLVKCSYNGVQFPCCKYFHEVDAEQGTCFAFNSMQYRNVSAQDLFAVNITTGPAALSFRVLDEAIMRIHSNEELSTKRLEKKFLTDIFTTYKKVDILVSVTEIENDPQLYAEYIKDRFCRFLHEIPDNMMFYNYPVYSYGACELAKVIKQTYKHCDCISPVRDYKFKKYYCNYTGLNCLGTYEALKQKYGFVEIEEDCLPSCVESDIRLLHKFTSTYPVDSDPGTFVRVKMSTVPKLRYQRNLIRTDLDIVVSIGGMAGLFFSASLLSIAEIFYLFLKKP